MKSTTVILFVTCCVAHFCSWSAVYHSFKIQNDAVSDTIPIYRELNIVI
jgi:hypothetical protein